MRESRIASWSNVCQATTRMVDFNALEFERAARERRPMIPRGGGRSFGDAAFVSHGTTLSALAHHQVDDVDEPSQTVTCDAGVPMGELHRRLERQGYHLHVYGGTQWATAGGSVAADVHGKNDSVHGSCGNNVASLDLLTPDGETHRISRETEPDLFAATVGGLGLTGFIRSVRFRVHKQAATAVRIKGRTVASMAEMIDCFNQLACDYHVGDWLLPVDHDRKGIFWYASHTDGPVDEPAAALEQWLPRVKLINRVTVGATSHLLQLLGGRVDAIKHVRRFHYGGVHQTLKNWNRFYGPNGFCEYQFVTDEACFLEVYQAFLALARKRSVHPFYGVVKKFGDLPRGGLLSFPRQGFAFSFQLESNGPNRRFMEEFTDVLVSHRGRIYLAKDSVILPRHLEALFPELPRWRAILKAHDPDNRMRSDLSIRLNMKPW